MEKLTKAMKMVSAAKLRRAQKAIIDTRPYAKRMDTLLSQLAQRTKRDIHPLMQERDEIKKLGVVVLTADKGLCGSFNTNIIKFFVNHINLNKDKDVKVIAVGKKCRDYFVKKPEFNVIGEYYNFFNELQFQHCVEIANQVIDLYQKEHLDRIDLIYNEFKSAITHDIVVKQLLPIVPAKQEEGEIARDYIYEPSPYKVLSEILPKHLHIQVWRILQESIAAEHGARMAAMELATKNEIDVDKYVAYLHSTFDQVLDALGLDFDEIIGLTKLERFM